MTQKFVRLPDVKGQTGLSRSSIYAKIATGSFPTAVPIGIRAVAWIEEEVQEWIRKQIKKR
ncbi:MAG: AlpA family phage regulatory protein [Terracidiphilus sp.]